VTPDCVLVDFQITAGAGAERAGVRGGKKVQKALGGLLTTEDAANSVPVQTRDLGQPGVTVFGIPVLQLADPFGLFFVAG
jgi:hypothetical protein